MMASDIAKFMNGAGKIHERFMNRKKPPLPFHVQFMNDSDFLFQRISDPIFMNEYHTHLS